MKYIALLRGINVGGNTLIKMSELKTLFEKTGFTQVATYINSGNVIFESDEKNIEKLTKLIEKSLLQKFKLALKVALVSEKDLQTVIEESPDEWKHDKDLRCYVAFVLPPTTPVEVANEIELTENVDFLKIGKEVLYMTTKKYGLMQSSFKKLIGKKIYKSLTMRNFNTVKKVLSILDE